MPIKEEAKKQKKCDCTKGKDCTKDEKAEEFARLKNKAEVFAKTIAQLCESSARVHELWLSTHEDASAEEKHGQLVATLQSAIMVAFMNI